MNIKEALESVLAGKGRCAMRKDEKGEKVYLHTDDYPGDFRQCRVHLDVADLIATDWKVMKRGPR